MGLFTGMSALSMIEVVFLIVNLVKHLIKKCKADQLQKHIVKNKKIGDQENVSEFDPKKSINKDCNDEAKNKIQVSPLIFISEFSLFLFLSYASFNYQIKVFKLLKHTRSK